MNNQAIDLKLMSSKFIAIEQRELFLDLKKSNFLRSIFSITIDIFLVVFAYFLIFKSYYFVPVSLILIGSRQRAISNLTHDASHINLFSNRWVNDVFANIFCALPMFETVQFYRKSHNKHHQFLGNNQKDPDSASHLMYGYDDSNPWTGNPYRNYCRLIFNIKSFKSSLFGSILHLSAIDLALVVVWWTTVGVLLAVNLDLHSSVIILGVWFLSKMTIYHFIRIVAEFLDHSGLKNEGIVAFSRNLPHDGLLRFIFHPNCDTFHIVHHLYPKIPHYNLREADRIISSNEDYLSAHHCDSYFFGKHSAINCWVGKCEGNLK